MITEALAEFGLPASQAATATRTQVIKDSQHEAFDEVALHVGTPVLRIADTALFPPVVAPASRGEATGRLWGGLLATATTDGFFGSQLQGGADRCARTSPSRPIMRTADLSGGVMGVIETGFASARESPSDCGSRRWSAHPGHRRIVLGSSEPSKP